MATDLPMHAIDKFIIGGDSGVSGSMAGNITSLAVNIDEVTSYSIQATWTGAPAGTVRAQGSNNIAILGWTDITDSISAVAGPGTYLLNVERPSYTNVQFIFTFVSGTGTMNAVLNAKRD